MLRVPPAMYPPIDTIVGRQLKESMVIYRVARLLLDIPQPTHACLSAPSDMLSRKETELSYMRRGDTVTCLAHIWFEIPACVNTREHP